ncbi:MAG TPA: MFS transporter [Burkholderiales bacterium]|nr:MFS transporter [Burkholderiales bacterium]
MSDTTKAGLRVPALAPFRVRSFRFQWPADLATSWAFEMETLILGWYVLVETQSVLMLTVFASLLYIGTLLAPMFGVMGDRIGHRNLLCAMRGLYATQATILMAVAFLGMVTPAIVLVITAVMGLVRPSDIGMRAALVAETMPTDRLVGAMSIQRTTQDSARIAGALTGAGLVAVLGMGPAYIVVVTFYATSVLLTFKAVNSRPLHHAARDVADASPRPSPWRDLREGFVYVWNTPHLLGAMCFAFLLNLTAFPLFTGLLPYVAKEVYSSDQTTLGYMVAGASFGALLGSMVLSRIGHAVRPARMGLVFGAGWYALLIVFAHTPHPVAGIAVLIVTGVVQSLGLIPMSAMLLRHSDVRYRGRVMGMRMLALYGNLPGLLISAPLIARIGFPMTATLYCGIGLAFTAVIAIHWRAHLWQRNAPANMR